jgi:predicted anti-sigma-YlaC factor YlaD
MGVRSWRRRRRALVCQQAVELVTDYLEGTLASRERSRFEAHLAGCPHCRAYLDQMRSTIRTLGRIEPGTVPPAVLDGLVAVYRRMRSGPE